MTLLLKSEASKGTALSAPATLYVGVLVAVPLGILVVYSFWTQAYVVIDRTITCANYKEALHEQLVRHLIWRPIWGGFDQVDAFLKTACF